MTKLKPYREELFQWIWHHLEFDCSKLRTTCGRSINIVETGEWNSGAGPDFLNAHLQIDGRDWFGSVEIHRKAGEWFQHNHHTDENFNSVILHVVYESNSREEVKTQDGFRPYTLELKPCINKKMHQLLASKRGKSIACAGNIAFINQEAFEQQIESAHREYLEYKIEELLNFYDASLPLSNAWKNCLIIQVYRTLGIPANKGQMDNLAQKIIYEGLVPDDRHTFTEDVKNIAFNSTNEIPWVQSGMRPPSRPRPRVEQAAALHFSILNFNFQHFFKKPPAQSWRLLTNTIAQDVLPGSSRLDLIRQIAYLPALYLLGDLLQFNSLRSQASEAWKKPVQHVPNEMKQPFEKAGFHLRGKTKMIGLAHQYKRYCKQKNCHRCEVFKKAIRS